MCQCWFIDYNKFATLMWNIDGGRRCVVEGGVCGNSEYGHLKKMFGPVGRVQKTNGKNEKR